MSNFLNSASNNSNQEITHKTTIHIPQSNMIISDPEIYLFNTENNTLEKIELGKQISIPNLDFISDDYNIFSKEYILSKENYFLLLLSK